MNGTSDYVVPIPPEDCCSAGTFVKEFDVGEIGVGNGAPDCHWVRDVLNARVAVIGPDPAGKIAVLVSVEVYMLFRNDLQEYYDMVRVAVGDSLYDNLMFFVHAQHNHEGPDTSGLNVRPINHNYYRYMLEQMRDATTDALNSMEEAYLFFGQDQFYYGLGDIRDPLMQDSTLRILRAYRNPQRTGTPITTIVNWGMHPEVTLGYDPTFDKSDCLKLTPPIPNCSAEGRYFTHDYPGHFSNVMTDLQGGGVSLYFNGAIGCQIGIHAPVWEITTQYPLGNGSVVPEGATVVPENFRMAYLIGRSLAQFAHEIPLMNVGSPIIYGEFDYKEITMMARITNFFFRIGLCPQTAVRPEGDPNRPFRIGNTMRKAYNCDTVNPTSENCVEDNYAYNYDNVTGLPFRVGNFMETEIKYLKLGPMKFFTIPGELAPELSVGLPLNFDLPSSIPLYYDEPEKHVTGQAYTMPGVLADMVGCSPDEPCWVFGLTQDEIGYMFPLSDWKILCTASEEECASMHESGALAYIDSASGVQCKNLTDYPIPNQEYYVSNYDYSTWNMVNHTCVYGTLTGQASDHYEEVRIIIIRL